MHAYIHTYVHQHIHTNNHIYIYVYIHTSIYSHACIHTYLHTYIHSPHICLYAYIHTCLHMQTHIEISHVHYRQNYIYTQRVSETFLEHCFETRWKLHRHLRHPEENNSGGPKQKALVRPNYRDWMGSEGSCLLLLAQL